ncbi:MAG: gliding motility-associated C-terminal domain-containing protein [Elusimicrobia bacterium]|nr:gliding motility-associated C-terminal domain-containing protein [Elusimicrobiota bacterium]
MKLSLLWALLRALGLGLAVAAVFGAPRPLGFSFTSVTNRMLTPNGDGRNDTAVFQYSNPRFSDVTGKVYDIRGRFVADLASGPATDTLQWDGKSNGVVVPTGVYIYVISAEGQTQRGTVVVIR